MAKILCSEAKSDHTKNTQCKQLRVKMSGIQNKTEEKKARDHDKWEAHGWLQTDTQCQKKLAN